MRVRHLYVIVMQLPIFLLLLNSDDYIWWCIIRHFIECHLWGEFAYNNGTLFGVTLFCTKKPTTGISIKLYRNSTRYDGFQFILHFHSTKIK